jgi:hypothetical protein
MREHRALTMGTREAGVPVYLDLVAHYQATDGVAVALVFRPESLAPHTSPQGVRWSGLDSAHRVPFVLLRQEDPGLQPSVFSAEDGVVYPYRWSARATDLAKEAERVTARLQALAQGRFETTISEWVCDRCPVRVSCPYWLGALEDAPPTVPDQVFYS